MKQKKLIILAILALLGFIAWKMQQKKEEQHFEQKRTYETEESDFSNIDS